ncbi:MAG: Methionyl-tRNA synthetase [Candidatus Nomurabacteria bacterium GW2011_GWE1_32_28]|uniref:Methionine--tRNA ligase n=1 Tax=Candidatus Nomurabacteria bacterium GW2011_GWF1_31_48 TaxID=1618767 RepID=A0A0F9YU70_9BACT|nr:MAG: Methionyl-tRNA synthetase [Candidatus Nomurabacteria bacterium GW2011_GWF2_30_133]KKP28446.1 MAG: Methionyl-tRNA synthetase [Candidatus Nomurabacteria bacterium GW2011_GWE2_31_40]KKP30026.1 MAG: Methionyl-tRNA synthetase [Candidatus Nomurabacteria bacterium GW2011_GWF1_31_48]KKP34545.1 MAG: Methionyl-tRNA synthetase [Candidatus Nomurabacteria bacterium GW2011_GWE1_32_28]HAS81057.1 methionine--tRNA ligase [Candidatus Nomurabacteria bacterium]
MKKESFYITTTLPYVNAPLHMGHALELVRADAIARYKKLIGYDVFFNTGTDEHGIKIYQKAKENEIEIQDFVDQGFDTFKKQLKMFGMSDDIHFVRTTDKHHEAAAQEFWKKVNDNGYIYKKNYETKYCIGCESEKTDSELEDDECRDHPGIKVSIINEENYFFKYSAFGDKLLGFYEKNPDFIVPDFRFNEIKAFVKKGLQDFSISRLKSKMPWGIAVPGDEDHVMYVWFDALTNYISTLGWPEDTEQFKKYWENGNPTQYCGKDNTRFQGAMWQAMLIAADLPNSHQVVVDGFITGEGGVRMSKTLGNVVDPREIVSEYGTDALRYFLLREVGSFEDSPFTLERFKDAYNSGLANGLGNLSSRIMTMAVSNNITISEFPSFEDVLEIFSEDEEIQFHKYIEKFDIKKAIDLVWFQVQLLDGIIQKSQPFKLVKSENLEDSEKGKKQIEELILGLYYIAKLLEPILPETSKKIQQLIKENKKPDAPLFLRKE